MAGKHAVVEMRLDDDTVALLRGAWTALAERGIDSQMLELEARLHVSLMVGTDLDVAVASRRLRQLLEGRQRFVIDLPYLGMFRGDVYVGFLGVTQTKALTELQNDIWCSLESCFGELHPHFTPENTVLHTTLAVSIPTPSLESYWDVVSSLKLPRSAQVQGVDVVEYFPARIRESVSLSEPGNA